jgi:hypothetical protein
MSRDESIRALRRANPRDTEGFAESLPDLDALHDRVAGSEAAGPPMRRRLPVHVRLAAVGAAAVVIVGVVAAVMLTAPSSPDGTKPGVITNAYAAVQKAMADTAAASKSGTISTRMTAFWPERPAPQIDTSSVLEAKRREAAEQSMPATLPAAALELNTVFKWHGDDMSLVVGTKDSMEDRTNESRFVGGRYYEEYDKSAPDDPQPRPTIWVRWPADSKDGPGQDDPGQWVDAARGDVTGSNLRRIIEATKGLKQHENADGSTTYSGTATAGAIKSDSLGVAGLPSISRPVIKVRDPQTPCAVSVTVGADGLIREVRCSYETDGGTWEYRSVYSKLGEAGAISAPDPSLVKDWDPKDGKG